MALPDALMKKLIENKDRLPPRIAQAVGISQDTNIPDPPPSFAPGRKGKVMSAMYLLGCSLSQIAYIFQVKRPTVTQAVKNNISPEVRRARPRNENTPTASWDQACLYFREGIKLHHIYDPVLLAQEIQKLVKPQLEDDNYEDVPYLRDEAGTPSSRIGEGSDGRAGADTTQSGAESGSP